jgi:transketolase
MRNEFAHTLAELAERDPRVVLLTGDLGYTVLEPFAERHPDRFFNAGVAEQNMLGLATGLAEAGFVPFVYSIATFASMRGYEFFRNGGALHELPVRLVGVGAGFDYSVNGVTHYAIEDVALMRVQPNITTIAPADTAQAQTALLAVWDLPRPLYLRIAKTSDLVPGLDGGFELGRAAKIGDGADVAIVALGSAAANAVAAAEQLRAEGIEATVGVVSSLNPDPVEDLVTLLGRVPLAVTIEEHYLNGGVGSLVSELVAERGLDCRVVRFGVREMPRGAVGSEQFLQQANSLTPDDVTATVLQALSIRTH